MTQLKKGQSVQACTIKGSMHVLGTVKEIIDTTKGQWVTIQPKDAKAKPFKTRPSRCKPA